MSELGARRGARDGFDFEGRGGEARRWLDTVYGTTLRLAGPLGLVRHHREDHGSVAFDHVRIEATFRFDSDPMPVLVVVDMLGGSTEYTRDGVTDRIQDGDTVLVAGWGMPFSGGGDHQDLRATTITQEALSASVADIDADFRWQDLTFASYVPHSAAAGARWRATVDQLTVAFPGQDDPLAHAEAVRLLGHTLLQTFPNNLVHAAARARTGTTSTVERAVRVIESHAHEDLSLGDLARECGVTPRALQYAFRRHLGCTPLSYVRRVRLDLARQALRERAFETVGDAAARNGFFNPGRFASDYRQVFEENPSQTFERSNT